MPETSEAALPEAVATALDEYTDWRELNGITIGSSNDDDRRDFYRTAACTAESLLIAAIAAALREAEARGRDEGDVTGRLLADLAARGHQPFSEYFPALDGTPSWVAACPREPNGTFADIAVGHGATPAEAIAALHAAVGRDAEEGDGG